jgi:DNA-binding beta-propeller fold protein YncE
MATRRDVLRWAGVLPAAGLLGACTRPPTPDVPPVPPAGNLLQVETGAGLGVVDVRDARLVLDPVARATTWDGAVLAYASVVTPGGGGPDQTRITVTGADGREVFRASLDGALAPRVVSPAGDLVALTPVAGAGPTPYRPAGRESTTIVVANSLGELHRLTVPGCVEPEAFAATGDALFVLDYLPPAAPEQYRVRVLPLATGGLQPLLNRSKQIIPAGAEEQMRGQGRQAVYSPSQQFLYTLYTHQPDHEHTRDLIAGARDDAPHVHAFVHTLSLDQQFAYCIDLPAPFGEGPPDGHAIALSRRGARPSVVDTGSGAIARLDGVGLVVAQTAPFPTGGGPTYAAVAPDDEMAYIGTGNLVHVYRTSTLTSAMSWIVPGPVHGLAVSRTGDRVWVGQPGGVLALDATTGRELVRVPVADLTAVHHSL